MTAAATSEFSAVSGTTEKPQHWLDQVTLEEEARRAFLETTLTELGCTDLLEGLYLYSSVEEAEKMQILESAARGIENSTIIALMSEKLFGKQFDKQHALPKFLESGIGLDLRDENTGNTLLMTECSRPRRTSAEEEGDRTHAVLHHLLLRNRTQSNPLLQNSDGETVSTLAARNGRVEMLGILAPFNGSGLRTAKGESPLRRLLFHHFMSADPQNPAEKPNTLWETLFSLIAHHDFAGMPETGPESFENISRTLQLLVSRSIQGINQEYGVAYLNPLIYFAHKNDRYRREEIAQLKAQLAEAQEKLGAKEVLTLPRPSQP